MLVANTLVRHVDIKEKLLPDTGAAVVVGVTTVVVVVVLLGHVLQDSAQLTDIH